MFNNIGRIGRMFVVNFELYCTGTVLVKKNCDKQYRSDYVSQICENIFSGIKCYRIENNVVINIIRYIIVVIKTSVRCSTGAPYVRITPPMFDRTQRIYTVVWVVRRLYAAAYEGIDLPRI